MCGRGRSRDRPISEAAAKREGVTGMVAGYSAFKLLVGFISAALIA